MTWKINRKLAETMHPIGRGAAVSAARQIAKGPRVIAGQKRASDALVRRRPDKQRDDQPRPAS